MKRIIAPIIILLALPSVSFAQTITVSWSPASGAEPATVPTLGTVGLLMLAVLVAVAALYLLKLRGAMLPSVLMLAVGGSLTVAAFRIEPVEGVAEDMPTVEIVACEADRKQYIPPIFLAGFDFPQPTLTNNASCPMVVDIYIYEDSPCTLVKEGALKVGDILAPGESGFLPYWDCSAVS